MLGSELGVLIATTPQLELNREAIVNSLCLQSMNSGL
jgi:hypothetical protein